ncbi:MAG TPA: hypothetical protein VKB36_17975 [Vicinamibacterales bacterium]|nr:hypothetical protein [Vicinamibacterales bacterium]
MIERTKRSAYVRIWRALGNQYHADAGLPAPTPDIAAPFPIPIADPDHEAPDLGEHAAPARPGRVRRP